MATKKAGSSKKGAAKKAAATQEPSDAKLKELQKRLNEDTRLRTRFLKDPGAVLRQGGVEIGPDKEAKVATYLRDLATPQREVFGAELARVQVGISVRIRIKIFIGLTV
jgi:hypothetical protein